MVLVFNVRLGNRTFCPCDGSVSVQSFFLERMGKSEIETVYRRRKTSAESIQKSIKIQIRWKI